MFRGLPCLLLSLFAVSACGPQTVHRPIELFIAGLSGDADRLTVLLFVQSEAVSCADVTLNTVQDLDAPLRVEWNRGQAGDRGLMLPEVQEGGVTLVAYAENAGGQPIQFACARIEYADIESPDVTVELSARVR